MKKVEKFHSKTSNGHRNYALELIEEVVPDAMLMDGHDNALIGYIDRFGSEPVACYDYNIVIENLMNDFDDYEEETDAYEAAVEWYQYNMYGAWVGEGTPCFLMRPEGER